MLQAIRSKAGSLVVKLLFAFLIISFGIWGIGDIFRQRGSDTVVATVGSTKIRADDLQVLVRQETERWRQITRGAVDLEQLKQLGLVDNALDQLVTRDLLELEANRLRLHVDQSVIDKAIVSNPAFQGISGTFDRNRLNAFLSTNRMNQQQLDVRLQRETARSDLTGAVADGAVAPATLVASLYRMRNEKRTAETALLPETSVPEPADPGEAELAAWYEQHQDFFRVPEYRALSLVTLRLDEIAQRIEVAEDKLREEYQARLVEFSTPEHRAIDQIVVSDEAKAKEAASEIAGGKDFLEIAKSVAGLEPDAVHLGTMTREELPPVVADAAFALDEGKVSEPISGPFGWHILRVTAIEPGKVEPFESVRDRLALELAREQARDRTWELSNQLDDALAGGGTIEEAAKQLELPMMTIAAIDPDGRDPGGKPVELPLAPAELLRTAFNTPQGQATRLTETRDGGFYVLRVDGVTPSSVKPLAEVKERATQLWKSEKRNEAVAAKAKALAEQVTGEKTLSGVGVAENLAATTTPPFSRNGAEAGLSPALASRLFAAKPGEVVTVPGESGVWIAQLKTIERPEGKPGEVGFEQLSRQLQDAMRNDLVAAFDRALRSRYPVEIRREELARFF